jgi:hypothetical protein
MDAQKARIRILAACFAAVSISVPAIAQTSTPAASVSSSVSSALSRVRIGNFGKVNDNYYRGQQPKGSDYRDLAALGVKTVIDLQKDGPSNEAGIVSAAGMKFFRPTLRPMRRSRSSSRS